MLLLVNKTFDLLQDGVIGRRFSHIYHLADSPLSGPLGRCRDLDLWTADRSRETIARWFRRVRLLGGAVPARVVYGCAKRQRVQSSCTPRMSSDHSSLRWRQVSKMSKITFWHRWHTKPVFAMSATRFLESSKPSHRDVVRSRLSPERRDERLG